ncbi:MAG TPA: 16S rRNA (cytosine(1402)-N(4))-methyltransferase RsmH [Gemmatimonadaceae bacterium]
MTSRFDSAYHAPVLVDEILDLFAGATRALDCTLGGGGHSAAMLDAGFRSVTGIDRDPAAIAEASVRLRTAIDAGRFSVVHGNYADAERLLPPTATWDAILLDLGVSSHQLDDASRGFSFREGAPLGMAMGGTAASAAVFLNEAGIDELTRVFKEYGDEPKAGRLSREVDRRRGHRPFVTSDDLVGAIRAVLGARSGPGDFARLFQAVRIAVNDELGALSRALPVLRDRLAPRGVLAVIAYHSGEDRLVKLAFREWASSCICPPKLPVCMCRGRPLGALITRKPITASETEVAHNVRARSAHLRAFRRED